MQLRRWAWSAAWVASLGLMLPCSPAFGQVPARPAASPATQTPAAPAATETAPAVTDVALRETGGLFGVVVDGQGIPMPGADVSVLQGGTPVTKTRTDALGQFSTDPLRGGVYQVVAGEGGVTLRVWEASAAPPSARSSALVVGTSQVVRGQIPFRKAFFSDAFIVTAIIAAAIAIPVAISSARNPVPPSS